MSLAEENGVILNTSRIFLIQSCTAVSFFDINALIQAKRFYSLPVYDF